jgi:hypothetical protein
MEIAEGVRYWLRGLLPQTGTKISQALPRSPITVMSKVAGVETADRSGFESLPLCL